MAFEGFRMIHASDEIFNQLNILRVGNTGASTNFEAFSIEFLFPLGLSHKVCNIIQTAQFLDKSTIFQFLAHLDL